MSMAQLFSTQGRLNISSLTVKKEKVAGNGLYKDSASVPPATCLLSHLHWLWSTQPGGGIGLFNSNFPLNSHNALKTYAGLFCLLGIGTRSPPCRNSFLNWCGSSQIQIISDTRVNPCSKCRYPHWCSGGWGGVNYNLCMQHSSWN